MEVTLRSLLPFHSRELSSLFPHSIDKGQAYWAWLIELSWNASIKPFFLLQNTPRFYDHPNIIHLPSTADLTFKTQFINTCDALLHSRYEGESFGSTCGEFSIRNKRVITYGNSRERNHIEILKDKGIYFTSPAELLKILTEFSIRNTKGDWNCYREFEPEPVMEIFKNIFISN